MSDNIIVWVQVKEQGASSAGMFRAKVPGGWLMKTYEDSYVSLHEEQKPQPGYEWRVTMCFVPDPHHLWELEAK